jgi:tRNA-dihydrouridine synthase C
MLNPELPALVLAPMDGITDAPMRTLQGATGAFSYAVSEFLRVSVSPLPAKVFRRDVPELANRGLTPTGLPVQVQILGGDPERMAISAAAACRAGATAIDINFGCPAPTVNRNDGGATLLKYPCRIRELVAAVRAAVPPAIPVSAKLRLGWDSTDAIHENAAMAAEGGASWLTIHARTRTQGYAPPVFWPLVGEVRRSLGLPIVANGDIWTLDDFLRCRDETGCRHFMIGRAALANPPLARQIAAELGIVRPSDLDLEWVPLFRTFVELRGGFEASGATNTLRRLKQWINLAYRHGDFPHFHDLKQAGSLAEFFERLEASLAADRYAAV